MQLRMSLHLQRLRSNWVIYLKARVLPSSGVASHCLSDTGKGFRILLTHCLKSWRVLIHCYSATVFLKGCDFDLSNFFCLVLQDEAWSCHWSNMQATVHFPSTSAYHLQWFIFMTIWIFSQVVKYNTIWAISSVLPDTISEIQVCKCCNV